MNIFHVSPSGLVNKLIHKSKNIHLYVHSHFDPFVSSQFRLNIVYHFQLPFLNLDTLFNFCSLKQGFIEKGSLLIKSFQCRNVLSAFLSSINGFNSQNKYLNGSIATNWFGFILPSYSEQQKEKISVLKFLESFRNHGLWPLTCLVVKKLTADVSINSVFELKISLIIRISPLLNLFFLNIFMGCFPLWI